MRRKVAEAGGPLRRQSPARVVDLPELVLGQGADLRHERAHNARARRRFTNFTISKHHSFTCSPTFNELQNEVVSNWVG